MKNYEALSDEQLIELLRKGESGPEEYLVKKYKGAETGPCHVPYRRRAGGFDSGGHVGAF